MKKCEKATILTTHLATFVCLVPRLADSHDLIVKNSKKPCHVQIADLDTHTLPRILTKIWQ